MKITNNLAMRLPVLVGLALVLGGCYTVLRHPTTDLAARGSEYNDCASCHLGGFDQPMQTDPYGYVNWPFADYYDCPWWLPDCGAGLVYAPGVGHDDGEAKPRRGRRHSGRNLGSRGGYAPPPVNPNPAGTPEPGSVTPAGEGEPVSPEGQQPGRKLKDGAPDEKKPEESKPGYQD